MVGDLNCRARTLYSENSHRSSLVTVATRKKQSPLLDTIFLALALALTSLTTTLSHVQAQTTPTVINDLPTQENTNPTKKTLTQGEIRAVVSLYARKNDVKEVLALAIVKCESGFNPNAKNPSSTAKGLFQFLNSTRIETSRRMGTPTFSPFDVEKQAAAGAWLLRTDGVRHWEASRTCWQKEL